jgi:hypothetical protein
VFLFHAAALDAMKFALRFDSSVAALRAFFTIRSTLARLVPAGRRLRASRSARHAMMFNGSGLIAWPTRSFGHSWMRFCVMPSAVTLVRLAQPPTR